MDHATMDVAVIDSGSAQRRATRALTRAHGTSLLELVTTLGILGVLLGAGVPGFAEVIERNRTTTVANRLLTDLARARGEAVTKASGAVVCPSADSRTCLQSHNFSRGWLGFRDRDGDGALDTGEVVFAIAQESDLQGRRVFTTAGRRSLRFRADGRNAGTNLTLRVCDATGAPQRLLIVNVGGRARIAPAPVTTAPCPAS